jgi:hypothetical protein
VQAIREGAREVPDPRPPDDLQEGERDERCRLPAQLAGDARGDSRPRPPPGGQHGDRDQQREHNLADDAVDGRQFAAGDLVVPHPYPAEQSLDHGRDHAEDDDRLNQPAGPAGAEGPTRGHQDERDREPHDGQVDDDRQSFLADRGHPQHAVKGPERHHERHERADAKPSEAPAGLAGPQAEREDGPEGREQPPGDPVGVFDQVTEVHLEVPGQVPRLGRPDGVGHPDAEAGDEPPKHQEQGRVDDGDD